MQQECAELKNIKYKTMLLSGTKTELNPVISNNISNIDEFLEHKCKTNLTEPWSKLDKTTKISCLHAYSKIFGMNNNLSKNETQALKQFLIGCLEKKKFQKVKDVNYDKEKGEIKEISNLQYIKKTGQFSLKRDQKRASTLKSLTPKAKHSHKIDII